MVEEVQEHSPGIIVCKIEVVFKGEKWPGMMKNELEHNK